MTAALLACAACAGGTSGAVIPPPPTFSSVVFPGGVPTRSLRLDFAGVPAGESATYLSAAPPGVMLVATFIDGVVFTVGPHPVVLSALRGVTLELNLGAPPPGSGRIGATISELSSGAGAAIPFALAPATTFSTGPAWNGPALTTLSPGASYFIFIGFV